MLNTHPPSPVPRPALLPPRRRRGGQPSNRNAFKHGLYARQHPTPLTRFSNYLARYQSLLVDPNPASVDLAIPDLHKQIDVLVGLCQSLANLETFTLFNTWIKVLIKTISISMRMKSLSHYMQQPYHDLQYVASHTIALVFYDFWEHRITRDADSFLIVSKKSYLNSILSVDELCPPFSEPGFPFLTPRQGQVMESLIPPALPACPAWDGSQPNRRRGRPPADPHMILDAIFWKIAHHARWQELPVGYPSMAVCRRYYRRIFRSGRLFTIYRRLYKDLCTRGRVDLATLVERGCFTIQGNKVLLRPGLKETWRKRTALLFMQLAYQMLRHIRREIDQERRRRFPSLRLSSKKPPSHAQPEHREEEFHFTAPDQPVNWPKSAYPTGFAPSSAASRDKRSECVRILGVNGFSLVLASNSPRRRELLQLGGWAFRTNPVYVDESLRPGEAPADYVLRLAEDKVRLCAVTELADGILLAADTAVMDGKAVLGKPRDAAEAAVMLKNLRGHTHQVLTGLALLRTSDGKLVTDLCVTDVPMRAYHDDEIETYVLTGDPLDKAGAYAIQHAGFHPVEGLRGCQASVMGLPLCHLSRSLRKLRLEPGNGIAAACQSALSYACPISAAVLHGEMRG